MPILIVKTNVPKVDFPSDFLLKMTKVLSETVGKPESVINVVVNPGMWMSFGGTEEPCGELEFISIGKLGEKENIKHSEKIMAYMNEAVGIPKDRMYIIFRDAPRSEVGFKGTTFAGLV